MRETQAAQMRTLWRSYCRYPARRTYVVIVIVFDVACDCNVNGEDVLSSSTQDTHVGLPILYLAGSNIIQVTTGRSIVDLDIKHMKQSRKGDVSLSW